jgi:hypothetical protein
VSVPAPRRAPRLAAAALLAASLCACTRSAAPPADPFPGDGFAGSWSRSGEHLVFTGPDLYNHIDGGAEVFLELGFELLEVQRYGSATGELTVELYRMTDHAAALGVYLLKCGQEAPAAELADRNTVNPYQLQLVRGSSYLTVNRMRGEPTVADMVGFARQVASALDGDATDPFAALPAAGRVAGSERVIRGPFTLQEVLTLGEGNVLQLGTSVTALVADYDEGGERITRLVAAYPDASGADAAFANLRGHLDPHLAVVREEPERLLLRDHASRFLVVVRQGVALTVEAGRTSAPPAG